MKKTPPQKSPKRFSLEFSRASMVFWSACFVLLLGWTFALGILVGRGFLTKNVKAISELQGRIAKIKEMVVHKKPPDRQEIGRDEPDPKFLFYDNLSAKKEDVAKKGRTFSESVQERAQRPIRSETDAFTVQLASLESEEKALAIVNRLKERGHAAYLNRTILNGKTWYRIRCGDFKDSQDAKTYSKALFEETGIAGYVTRADR